MRYELIIISLVLLPLLSAVTLLTGNMLKIKLNPRLLFQTTAWLLLITIFFLSIIETLPAYQFAFRYLWFKSLGVHFAFLLDGLSYLLLLVSALIFLLLGVFSKEEESSYYSSLLLVQTGLFGVLLADDALFFYFSYELMLFPVFYILYVFGNNESKESVYKFFLYTLFGSLLMLAAIIYCGVSYQAQFGKLSFLLSDLAKTDFNLTTAKYLLSGFLVAFAVKSPIFPFHSWLPKTYSSAPAGASVLLAALLFQTGVYGIFRFAMPLFPEAYQVCAPYLAILAVIGIVYGALLAWRQTTVKRVFAYSSVSHVAYSILGLSIIGVIGITGGLFQIVSHIFIACGLFMLAGFLYKRLSHDNIQDISGLASVAPKFSFFMLAYSLAAISVPLTINFPGEFMVLQAAYEYNQWLGIFALLGVVLGAVYMLGLCKKILFGKAFNQEFRDLNKEENSLLLALFALVLTCGIFPKIITSLVIPAVNNQVAIFSENAPEAIQYKDQNEYYLPEGITLTKLMNNE